MGLSISFLANIKRSILQCEACGAHVIPDAEGWFHACLCGGRRFCSLGWAPWKLTRDDLKLLADFHIKPDVKCL